jgi:hypothetical protein
MGCPVYCCQHTGKLHYLCSRDYQPGSQPYCPPALFGRADVADFPAVALGAWHLCQWESNALLSVRKSLTLTRMTLPIDRDAVSWLCLPSARGWIFYGGYLLKNSWFTLVGILGHAFVTTSLLSATFVYYRNADRWVQRVFAHWNQLSTIQPKSLS